MVARIARILEGDFEIEGALSWMYIDTHGRFRFLDPDATRKRSWWAKREWIEYGIDDVATADVVAQWDASSVGRSLGLGVLGGLAMGGWGAVVGAAVGGMRWEYEIEIVFRDGKYVVALVSVGDWDRIERALHESRREARRRVHRNARRQAIKSTPPSTPSRPSVGPSFDALGKPRTR